MVDCPGPCFHCTNYMKSRFGNSLLKWRRGRKAMTDTSRVKEGERRKQRDNDMGNMIGDPEGKIV